MMSPLLLNLSWHWSKAGTVCNRLNERMSHCIKIKENLKFPGGIRILLPSSNSIGLFMHINLHLQLLHMCYKSITIIQQHPTLLHIKSIKPWNKQVWGYLPKFLRNPLILFTVRHIGKDTTSELMIISNPSGWKTPLIDGLNLSNLCTDFPLLMSQRTPSFSTKSLNGLNVARFLL